MRKLVKISNLNTSEMYEAYGATSSEQVNTSSSDTGNKSGESAPAIQDKVNISSKVQQMNEIDQAVTASPDIRQDKVAEVEQNIKTGNYEADYNIIADKLLSQDLGARI